MTRTRDPFYTLYSASESFERLLGDSDMHIALYGGSGFIGTHLAIALLERGDTVTIWSRHPPQNPETAARLRYASTPDSPAALSGIEAVVYLAGILHSSPQASFHDVHAEQAQRLATHCQQAGVARFYHLSALHAHADGPSDYLKSKAAGEVAVSALLPTIHYQPSVVFGEGDSLFNSFADILRFAPVLPLACAQSRFAPVYVGDLVQAIIRDLDAPPRAPTEGSLARHCVGPDTMTLADIVRYCAVVMQKRRTVLPLPDFVARLQGKILQILPNPLFTYDNYLSLQVDSVSDSAPIGNTPVEAIVPQYLGQKDQHASLQTRLRQAARD